MEDATSLEGLSVCFSEIEGVIALGMLQTRQVCVVERGGRTRRLVACKHSIVDPLMEDLVRLNDLVYHRNHPGERHVDLSRIARQRLALLLNNMDLE